MSYQQMLQKAKINTQHLAPHSSTLKTIKIILKTSPPASKIHPVTLLPTASTLVPANMEQSPPCPAPPDTTQRPAPHYLTLKTVKIVLKTSPPASTIRPATLLPPEFTLGPADVDQSPPCLAPPFPTQRTAPHPLTLHTPNQPPIPISFPTTHLSTLPSSGPT